MPLTTKHMKSNTIVSDLTPYGNDGIVSGANITNEGAVFDGVDDYIQSLDDSMDDFVDVTFNFWIKPTSFSIEAATSIISKRAKDSDGYFIFTYKNTGNELVWDYGGNGNRWYTAYVPTLNQWQCITLTRNSSGRYLYVNGESYSSSSNAGNKDLLKSNRNISIGRDGIISNYPFNGSVSNVRIYNRALSEEEVKLLYDKGR